jgi:hypothetical protein
MSSSIGSSIASFGASYIPDLADAANIQSALKSLYFGSTGAAENNNGIYGALYTLYTGSPTIGGAAGTVTIAGNLTVNGTTTTINSTTINVDDKLIELGAVASPTNTTANGGGISLKGSVDTSNDKTILWDSTNANWTTSENWNIASGKTLKINNVTLLDTNAPKSMATLMGYTSTATASGTTTLTNTSSCYQQFTGTLTQTVVLPVTSTLIRGWTFHVVNNSTGNVTVNSSGGNQVIVVIPGTTAMVTCIGTTLTTAADWEAGLTDFSTYTGTGGVVLNTSPVIAGTLTTATVTTLNNNPITITESAHATSRRASIQVGQSWEVGQDSDTNGVKDFYIYGGTGTQSRKFSISPTTGTISGSFASSNAIFFGDGSDGNVTITTATTLSRDMFYNNLTISGASGRLQTNGYRVFVAGVLDVTAAVANAISHNNSTFAASPGTNGGTPGAGTGGTETTLGPLAGISGTNGAAGVASTPTGIAGVAGVSYANTTNLFPHGIYSSTNGGNGSSGSQPGGAGGSHTLPTRTFGARRAWIDWTPIVAGPLLCGAPGTGGGSGGSAPGGGNSGGGGGGGASCYALAIYANTINRGAGTATGFINMVGGKGGNGGTGAIDNGHGGGGSGGQGGFVYIVYGTLTGTAKASAIRSTGGQGGDNGGSTLQGTAGGDSGAVMLINLSTGVISYTAPVNGANGTTPSGGAGGLASVTL